MIIVQIDAPFCIFIVVSVKVFAIARWNVVWVLYAQKIYTYFIINYY